MFFIYLEDGNESDRKCIEVGGRRAFFEIKLSAKKLHTQKREY